VKQTGAPDERRVAADHTFIDDAGHRVSQTITQPRPDFCYDPLNPGNQP